MESINHSIAMIYWINYIIIGRAYADMDTINYVSLWMILHLKCVSLTCSAAFPLF